MSKIELENSSLKGVDVDIPHRISIAVADTALSLCQARLASQFPFKVSPPTPCVSFELFCILIGSAFDEVSVEGGLHSVSQILWLRSPLGRMPMRLQRSSDAWEVASGGERSFRENVQGLCYISRACVRMVLVRRVHLCDENSQRCES